ncbi:MAG: aminodeoxychorismate lyase, partial [Campylobacter sp.]|nr:aminodeoxychorismate lyase [Campylobacter sp.]
MKFFRFLCFFIEAILIFVASILFDLTTKIPNEKIVEIPEGSASKILSELSKKYPYFTKFDARILASFG